MHRRVKYLSTDDVVSVSSNSTGAYVALSESQRREMINDPVPNLTGPYLSTGTELDQSEDIILTTI
jgi:hypothetical protein